MPDSSPTIARREPTIRLNSVDLPTFGRPTMARRGSEAVMDEEYPRRDSRPRLSGVIQAVRNRLDSRGRVSLRVQWNIIETLWHPLRSPPLQRRKKMFPSTSFSLREACSHAPTPHTNSAEASFRWRKP